MRRHPNDIDRELYLIKKRIETLFSSGDPEMVKLGQRLCHQHRINYYVLAQYEASFHSIRGRRPSGFYSMRVKRYSVSEAIYTFDLPYYTKVYKITLKRDYKPIRAYTKNNLIYQNDLKYRARHKSLTKLK